MTGFLSWRLGATRCAWCRASCDVGFRAAPSSQAGGARTYMFNTLLLAGSGRLDHERSCRACKAHGWRLGWRRDGSAGFSCPCFRPVSACVSVLVLFLGCFACFPLFVFALAPASWLVRPRGAPEVTVVYILLGLGDPLINLPRILHVLHCFATALGYCCPPRSRWLREKWADKQVEGGGPFLGWIVDVFGPASCCLCH